MSIKELKKILYVEDEQDVQDIVVTILEDVGGFKVKACLSGEEALKIAKEYKPDLFLLDVMIPDMDGPSIVKNLRATEEFRKTPVIYITAKVQMHEMVNYKGEGILGIIRKPFDPLKISDFINRLWDDFQKEE